MLSLFKSSFQSVRYASSFIQPSQGIKEIYVHGQHVIKMQALKTSTVALSEKTLLCIANQITKTAQKGSARILGSASFLRYVHTENILTTEKMRKLCPHIYEAILTNLAYFATIETCVTVEDKAIELMIRQSDLDEKDVKARFPKQIQEHIKTILHQLARHGMGSPEAPLDAKTIPIVDPTIQLEIDGEEILFSENDKLFSMIIAESPLHPMNLFTIQEGEIEIFRITGQGKKHGLHHSMLPIVNLAEHKVLNIRDVISFYTAHLGVRSFKAELSQLDAKRGFAGFDEASDEQIKSIVIRNPIYWSTLQKGDTCLLATGLGFNSATVGPQEVLIYRTDKDYIKLNIFECGFRCIDSQTGKAVTVPVSFDADRFEICGEPISQSKFIIPEGAVLGHDNDSDNYTRNIKAGI